MNGHPVQTLSQKRAAFALGKVQDVVSEDYGLEFRSYAANLPPMIQMNGFGQALAFCRSKASRGENGGGPAAYRTLYNIVSSWLTETGQPYEDCRDVLDGVTAKDMGTYRLAQAEALALLDWVKRFATAFIEIPEEEAQQANTSASATTETPP